MHVQKIKEENLAWETYLESVDRLRNDEECRSPVKMNFLELDLGVAMSQSITLAPPSTCQIRETSTNQSNEWDLQSTEWKRE